MNLLANALPKQANFFLNLMTIAALNAPAMEALRWVPSYPHPLTHPPTHSFTHPPTHSTDHEESEALKSTPHASPMRWPRPSLCPPPCPRMTTPSTDPQHRPADHREAEALPPSIVQVGPPLRHDPGRELHRDVSQPQHNHNHVRPRRTGSAAHQGTPGMRGAPGSNPAVESVPTHSRRLNQCPV
jgi:hypothetical protein